MVIWGLLNVLSLLATLVFMNIGFFLSAAFWKQTGHRERPVMCGQESPISDCRQPLSAEMLITVEHAPIDVINQVNETQCQ